jgi:protein TonB
LLAAIKENRAGILRSDVAPKAPPHPETQVPAQEPPAKVQQSKLPEPMPAPARVPASSVAPAPLSISERIDRHPAIPTSRNAIAASAPLRGENQSRLAPSSSPAAAIDKIPGGRFTLLIVGAVIAVGGIATGLILRSHRTETPRAVAASAVPATPPAPVNNFPLQLQVEPQGKQTNVRWNPQSTLISQSREGRLVITENNQKPRTIPLGLDQLKFGHLTYQPQTDRVEFRLEVVDATGSVAEESVLSLANPPAPAAAQATTAVAASGTPQAPVGVPKSEAPPAPSAAQAPAANRPAARAFNPPAVNRSPAPGGIVDAPPEVSANVAAPEALPSAQVPRAAAPPPPTSSPRPLLVESNLQAAKLIAKVTPVYPALARSARVQGTVHFKATIGKDGSVQNLEMVGGPSILRQPAIDAVKKWKYQPTVLNGQPMEVVTSIDVTFTLGQ